MDLGLEIELKAGSAVETSHQEINYKGLLWKRYCVDEQIYEWRTTDGRFVVGNAEGRQDCWYLKDRGVHIITARDRSRPQDAIPKCWDAAAQRANIQSGFNIVFGR
jgi:hypothetical protein